MNRATELRILKLESAAPSPPSGFDEFTSDELMVQLLEGYSEILDRTDLPAAELQEVQNWRRVIVDDISLTANLRSGFWTRLPVVGSYQDDLAFAARRWAADGGKSTYVPALNHGDTGAGEYDGFDCIGSFVSDLMERRAALWSHPLVQRIVKEAPKATADEFSNCQGRPR